VDQKQRATAAFAAVEPDLRKLSRWMYDHPEIAFQERATSARLVAFLQRHGFDVEYPAYGLETAFAARHGASGPEVVLCCEYDALPEVGHACGHNLIAAAAIGAGVALHDLADELGIRVTVLGTPAEETYGGKIDLIAAGAFQDAALAMMIHPHPHDIADPKMLAVAHIDLTFYGRESHAAMAPAEGINALDAAVQAYVNVSTLRQALLPSDKVHGIITHGGGAPNVIPGRTEMAWYVRAASKQRLDDELFPRVIACFEAAATATGCTLEVTERGHSYADLVSNPVLTELFAANAAALGRDLAAGSTLPVGSSGSTDMGNVSHLVPSIHPFLSIDSLPAVNHQREFAAATLTPAGERAIHDGALAMAGTVIDVAAGDRWGAL
jgi:amidohydrolase